MKATRGIVMLVIALLAGLAAVVLAAKWMQTQSQSRGGRIAVAVADIDLGSRISGEVVRMADWPAGSVPAGAITDLKSVDGRVAKTSMARGEPILENKLAPVGTKGGLSAVVGEGKRAITVRVNDVIGVAGFALPGNYVDIMVNTQEEANTNVPDDKGRPISKIVLEHILVLAVAQQANRDETKPKVVNAVTLEVTPDQAEKLDLARSVGTLSLVLRNQVDPDPAKTAGATKNSLLGVVPPPPPAPVVRRQPPRQMAAAPRSTNCVEVIRGPSRSVECF
jgi:pilus assembly protein CpaB